MAKRKTKKEDAGSTYGARRQEDQLRGAEERSTEPGRMAPLSLEPALGQSMQEEEELMDSAGSADSFFSFILQKRWYINLYTGSRA